MRKLSKPNDGAVDVFLLCADGVKETELRARFKQVTPDIQKAAESFEAAAAAAALYLLEEKQDVAGLVTAREMAELYDQRMARAGSRGRRIYDKLKLLTSTCPLCGHRPVSGLDHQLPRSKFPALAVTPTNLVPACGDCNKKKHSSRPRTAEEQTFHPYFDDFGREPWLHAELLESSPPVLRFFVRPPSSWPALWGARARHHFKFFELAELYTAQAAQELVDIRYQLTKLRERAGAKAVHGHLKETADSLERSNPNSWKTAMYKALGASYWFCTEGLASIPSESS
jgi:HNH endonuclease